MDWEREKRIIIFNKTNMKHHSETHLPLEDHAQVFKALAHAARLQILYALRDGEHCVCHLEAHLGLRQAYLSQQLGVLRAAGLVELRRDGWNRYYQVTDAGVFHLLDMAHALLPHSQRNIQIVPNPNCPCPCCSVQREANQSPTT